VGVMAKKDGGWLGFFEGVLRDFETMAIANASKGKDGKPDPYKTMGALHGLRGDHSLEETLRTGEILGAMGAFDKKDTGSSTNIFSGVYDGRYLDADNDVWYDLADDDWRMYADDNDYDIDPEDYETEEEYQDAIEEAEAVAEERNRTITVPVTLTFSVGFADSDSDTEEERAREEKIQTMKDALIEKYSEEYPQIFGKNVDKRDITQIATSASKKKKTSHLPVEMFFYLAEKYSPIAGLELFKILDYGRSTYSEVQIYEKRFDLAKIINSEKWTVDDCYTILEIIRYQFFYNSETVDGGLYLIDILLATGISDESIYDLKHVFLVLMESIVECYLNELTEEDKKKLLKMCSRLDIPKKHKECYSQLLKRLEFERKANAVLRVLRPGEMNMLKHYSPEEDFIEENIESFIWDNNSDNLNEVFARLEKLCTTEGYNERQQKWIDNCIAKTAELIVDWDYIDDAYEWASQDTELKSRMFLLEEKCAPLFGYIASKAFMRFDDDFFITFLTTCMENYSATSKAYIKFFDMLFKKIDYFEIYPDAHENFKERFHRMIDTLQQSVDDTYPTYWKEQLKSYKNAYDI